MVIDFLNQAIWTEAKEPESGPIPTNTEKLLLHCNE